VISVIKLLDPVSNFTWSSLTGPASDPVKGQPDLYGVDKNGSTRKTVNTIYMY